MKLTSIGLVIVLLFSFCLVSNATDYKKETSTATSKPQLPLDELDLINLILTGTNPGAEIRGQENSSDTILFSGKNHDTSGNVITGGQYAIGCNIGQSNLDISNVTLEGTNGTIESNVNYTLNMNTMAPFLRKNADITITEDTLLENTTLGSSSDYKIVYVNNSKLTLSTGFTGYGVLYIEDKNHNEEEYILEMLNNAVWYGAIIVNQTGEDKKTKIFLKGTGSEETFDVGDFSMLGINYLTIGNNAHINSGDIGVSAQSGSMVVANNNNCSGSLFANTVVLGNNCRVDGDVHYNKFKYGHNFNLKGDKKTPLSFPYLTLPEFPSFNAGSQSIIRNNNATYTLHSGSYKNITFKRNCTLILTGGEYNIQKLTMGSNCKIKYMAASTIRIKKKLTMGKNAQIIPFTHHGGGIVSPFMIIAPIPPFHGGVDADDCIFYIQGDYKKDTDVFKIDSNATLFCNVYAPNTHSVIKLGKNANCTGAFIGNKIIAANNINVTLKSAFSGKSTGAFIGNKAIAGKMGKNSQIIPFTHHGSSIFPFMIIAPVAPHYGKVDVDDSVNYKDTDVFKIGKDATLFCNAYASNSVTKLGNNANYKGAFVGDKIIAANNINVALQSTSSGNGNGTAQNNVEIYGSLILQGNKFYIPSQGANINGYYCREVLEKVNAELESRPYNVWFNWKETE